jgi:hypothetical protein
MVVVAQAESKSMLTYAVLLMLMQVIVAGAWVYSRMYRGRRTAAFGDKPVIAEEGEYDAVVIGANTAGYTVRDLLYGRSTHHTSLSSYRLHTTLPKKAKK